MKIYKTMKINKTTCELNSQLQFAFMKVQTFPPLKCLQSSLGSLTHQNKIWMEHSWILSLLRMDQHKGCTRRLKPYSKALISPWLTFWVSDRTIVTLCSEKREFPGTAQEGCSTLFCTWVCVILNCIGFELCCKASPLVPWKWSDTFIEVLLQKQ